jgi:hypothetical protein
VKKEFAYTGDQNLAITINSLWGAWELNGKLKKKNLTTLVVFWLVRLSDFNMFRKESSWENNRG